MQRAGHPGEAAAGAAAAGCVGAGAVGLDPAGGCGGSGAGKDAEEAEGGDMRRPGKLSPADLPA